MSSSCLHLFWCIQILLCCLHLFQHHRISSCHHLVSDGASVREYMTDLKSLSHANAKREIALILKDADNWSVDDKDWEKRMRLLKRDLQKPFGGFQTVNFILVTKCEVTTLRFEISKCSSQHFAQYYLYLVFFSFVYWRWRQKVSRESVVTIRFWFCLISHFCLCQKGIFHLSPSTPPMRIKSCKFVMICADALPLKDRSKENFNSTALLIAIKCSLITFPQ